MIAWLRDLFKLIALELVTTELSLILTVIKSLFFDSDIVVKYIEAHNLKNTVSIIFCSYLKSYPPLALIPAWNRILNRS